MIALGIAQGIQSIFGQQAVECLPVQLIKGSPETFAFADRGNRRSIERSPLDDKRFPVCCQAALRSEAFAVGRQRALPVDGGAEGVEQQRRLGRDRAGNGSDAQ